MSTQTPNFNFDLREGTDIFNPLSTNANWESLDTILKNLQEKGGITTYTTTASANLLKLSGTPVVNDTVFKFVAAGDANTWTGASGGVVNNIVGLDGVQKKITGGNLYVAWVNAANAMVVIAWPDVVDAQTFDGKGPTEWASKAQLDAVNQTAANATQTAQAAATVANNALDVANAAKISPVLVWENPNIQTDFTAKTISIDMEKLPKKIVIEWTKNSQTSGVIDSGYTDPVPTSIDFPDNYGGVLAFYVTALTSSNASYTWRRRVAMQTAQPSQLILTFSDCDLDPRTGSTSRNNQYIIPWKIYAYQ